MVEILENGSFILYFTKLKSAADIEYLKCKQIHLYPIINERHNTVKFS